MPNPTSEDRVSRILTTISVATLQSQTQYVAPRVFPVVRVQKQTDKYYVWPKEDWLRDDMQRRGDSEESAGSGMRLSNDSYYATVWALHKDIGSQTRSNLANEVNLERSTTLWLTRQSLIRQEKQWAQNFFTAGKWGTDFTPATLWSDDTMSDPIADIEVARRQILVTTGIRPNTLVLGYDVFAKLKNHPDILGRYQYTATNAMVGRIVTTDMLAALFEVDRVFVAEMVENTADEGLPATMSFVYGKHALLCYAAPEPGLETPTAGYTFSWVGDERNVSQGLGETVGVRNFYIEPKKTDRYEIEIAFDHKIVSAELGYFFPNAVA